MKQKKKSIILILGILFCIASPYKNTFFYQIFTNNKPSEINDPNKDEISINPQLIDNYENDFNDFTPGSLSNKVNDASMESPFDTYPLYSHLGFEKWTESIQQVEDINKNGISDVLEQKINTSKTLRTRDEKRLLTNILNDQIKAFSDDTEIISEEEVPVIVHFPNSEFEEYYTLFSDYNGKTKTIFKEVLNGFAGTIDYCSLLKYCENLKLKGIPFLVEHDSVVKCNIYDTTRNMNLRPYVWNDLDFKGDEYSSIAILDTGIDDSHNSFAPGYSNTTASFKIVGWKDFVNDLDEPYDDNGHGTHCAGIAAGQGVPNLDNYGRLVETSGNVVSNSYGVEGSNGWIVKRFDVFKEGAIDVHCKINTSAASPDEFYIKVFLLHENMILDSFESLSNNWDGNLSYDVTTSTFGSYEIKIQNIFVDGNEDYYVDGIEFSYAMEVYKPYIVPALYGCGDPWKGVAPNANLVGIKVLNSMGFGFYSDIIGGIEWAVVNKEIYNITTLSMSLGSIWLNLALLKAVDDAVENGLVVVVAAGNDGGWFNLNNIGSPGLADNVITVAAMNKKDQVTSYSSSGGRSFGFSTTKPDIVAPGGSLFTGGIFSADTNDNDVEGKYLDGYTNDLYEASGTSMATPAVAGSVNLLINAMGGIKNWSYSALQAKTIKALLLMSATETFPLQRELSPNNSPFLDRGGKDIHEGYGRINIDVAIEAWIDELLPGTSINSFISSSSINPSSKHAIGCHVNLIAGEQYKFELLVPIDADFDIYLYNSIPTSTGEPILVASSVSSDLGGIEELSYTPSQTGIFFLIVKAISGEGDLTLSIVTNTSEPTLYNGNIVYSGTPTQRDLLTFTVMYLDPDDICPNYVQLSLNGKIYEMWKVNSNDDNYADGCTYQYETYLQPGSYNVTFICKDGRFIKSLVWDTNFVISSAQNDNSPVLSNAGVNPMLGYQGSTIFTFSVDYVDLDNDQPDEIYVIINSTAYSMIKQTPSDNNFMDGCTYEYRSTFIQRGVITYSFICFNGLYSHATNPMTGPKVELGNQYPFDEMYLYYLKKTYCAPTEFENCSFSQISGDLFEETITWTSEDGTPSISYGERNVSRSTRLWSGESFESYGLTGKAHTNNWIFTNVSIRDKIPIFMNSNEGDHEFEVVGETTYKIAGIGELDAWVLKDTENKSEQSVALFEKNTGILLKAMYHTYKVYYYTSYELVSTNAPVVPKPNLNAPLLSEAKKGPSNGNQATEFTFRIIYSDVDNNEPEWIYLIIDGQQYAMNKQDLNDMNYIDGCIYEVKQYFQPGDHPYHFECDDGKFSNVSPEYYLTVAESTNYNEPFLENLRVTPNIGYVDSTFVFTVDYYDLDNNAPEYIIGTVIQGLEFQMIKQDPLDNNYMDGCCYYFSSRLENASEFEIFQVDYSDGSHALTSGQKIFTVKEKFPFNGMNVNYTMTLNIIDMESTTSLFPIKYSVNPDGTCRAHLFYFPDLYDWEFDEKTRRMYFTSRIGLFASNSHTPFWIFNNMSMDENILISVGPEGDHCFKFVDELVCNYPGIGPLEIIVLKDQSIPGSGLVWYERSTGMLLNGTFNYGCGNYYLSLTGTNAEMNLLIFPDFTVDKTIAYVNEPISFSYTGIGGNKISDYLWYFGDGLFSHGQSTTYAYSTPGIYNVTIIVYDDYYYEYYIFTKVAFITINEHTIHIKGGTIPFGDFFILIAFLSIATVILRKKKTIKST